VHERDISAGTRFHRGARSAPLRFHAGCRVRVARAMDRTWRSLAFRRDARRAARARGGGGGMRRVTAVSHRHRTKLTRARLRHETAVKLGIKIFCARERERERERQRSPRVIRVIYTRRLRAAGRARLLLDYKTVRRCAFTFGLVFILISDAHRVVRYRIKLRDRTGGPLLAVVETRREKSANSFALAALASIDR